MNRWTAAVGSAVIFGGLAWAVVGIVTYAVQGCDEGPCRAPWWQVVARWAVPAFIALLAAWWGGRRAERTNTARRR
jgi:hypothetical protein